MQDNDKWVKALRDKLNDATEPLPSGGWERLSREIAPVEEIRITTISWRRRLMAVAACVALLIGSGISLVNTLVESPEAAEVVAVNRILQSNTGQEPEVTTLVADGAQLVEEADLNQYNSGQSVSAMASLVSHSAVPVVVTDYADCQSSDSQVDFIESVNDNDMTVVPAKVVAPEKSNGKMKSLPSSQNAVMVKRKSNEASGWSMGLAAANSMSSTNTMPDHSRANPLMSVADYSIDNIYSLPKGMQLIFRDGIPFLQDVRDAYSYSHKPVMSFGFSVAKNIWSGLSLETGVSYSKLSSELTREGYQTLEQNLHFIGIPIKLNWSFLKKDWFSLYIGAGAMVEKCMAGKLGDDNYVMDKLLWSINGALGAAFNISERLQIYAEPGVGYYFNNGSTVRTIREDSPLNLTLKAGIRLTY